MAEVSEAAIEKATAGLPPATKGKVKEAVEEAVKSSVSAARQNLKKRHEALLAKQWDATPNTIASFVGGAGAEFNRRKLTGRFVSSTRGQAALLALEGWGVQKIADATGIPYLANLGSAHAAVAGQIASVELYGSKDNPDAMKIALEGTTHKAVQDAKDAAAKKGT